MATIQNLHRYHVRESILTWNQTPGKLLPDFKTRAKTSFAWSKVYISVVNDKVNFVELNFFQRVIRYLFGAYRDTILENSTKIKVVNFVHDMLTHPAFQDMLFVQSQIQTVSSVEDQMFLKKIIDRSLENLPTPKTDQEKDNIQDDLTELQVVLHSKIEAHVKAEYKDDYIPVDFLDKVLQLAKTNPKTSQNVLIWDVVEGALSVNPLNLALFKELLRVIHEDAAPLGVPVKDVSIVALPCQGIEVLDETKKLMVDGLKRIRENHKMTDHPTSWKELIGNYLELVKVNDAMTNLRDVIKPALLSDEKQMVAKLENKLIEAGAHKALFKEYLSDKVRLAERLFFHCELAKEGAEFSKVSTKALDSIAAVEKLMRNKIEAECESKANTGGGDCFFLSCNDLQPSQSQPWREVVKNYMSENISKFFPLVENRMASDDLVPIGMDVSDYLEWIGKQGNWGSHPELEAFSQIVQRPVIVVQKMSNSPFQWSASFNLHFDGEPYVFINYGAVHYEAMVKKS